MEHLGIIIAIVGSVATLIGVVIGLFLWTRSEANADRHAIVNLIVAIKDESKDFHGRLCKIEERRLEK